MSDDIRVLIEGAKAKDFQALARLISRVESLGPQCLQQQELLNPPNPSFRMGITGPPGAGKSTLIGQMISEFRAQNLSVGVVAVDPSSPFTKGAILGDRIRYSEHYNDPQVFIRSFGSRGSLGGLSASTYLALRAFDIIGFDVVLIETVGVGQTELEIINVADWVGVVLVPESGDSIQAMKAGLMEIADGFIVNKSDRPGAGGMVNELEASFPGLKVFETVATEGRGVQELVTSMIKAKNSANLAETRVSSERLKLEARALLRMDAEREIDGKVDQIETPTSFAGLFS